MSGRSKKAIKTKTSIIYCEEKFNCDGEHCEALFDCVECSSKQCKHCEITLHSSKLDWHERKPIDPPSPETLCQSNCERKNYADITCTDCRLNQCNACFEKVHSKGKKKNHVKHPFRSVTASAATEEGVRDEYPSFTDCMSDYFSTPLNSLDTAPLIEVNSIMEPSIDSAKSGKKSHLPDGPEHEVPTRDLPKSKTAQQTNDIDDEIYSKCKAFLLADQDEKIAVNDEANFVQQLTQCEEDSLVKVLSIFGNTGDGKSHTLNHTFFGGREIFQTSSNQKSCTLGVWAAFDPVHKLVVLDTEGLLGVSPNQNQRTRLLLKVLAISDVVIYRSKADRLHNDLFTFIGDASKAYSKHFTEELKAASQRCQLELPMSLLGPAVIVFHETQHTHVLGKDRRDCPDSYLKERFAELHQDISSFSSVQYAGTQTTTPPTDFHGLLLAVTSKLRDTSVRAPRKPAVIFRALKVLNEKFSGNIAKSHPASFPDQYFTCALTCMSCRSQCRETVNHTGVQHTSTAKCKYMDQYDNRVYLCRVCHEQGREEVVVPKAAGSRESSWLSLAKYAWSGYVLECKVCGVIYRSRQYWYGNEDPVKSVVRTEVRHIWPGDPRMLQGTHNAARRLIDGLHYVSDSIASVSAKPTKAVSMWLTDQIAPPYWVPNAKIQSCRGCQMIFDNSKSIHHCRACGEGFCDACSEKKRPVPERGWGLEPVRVCDSCYDHSASSMSDSGSSESADNAVMPRKLGEALGSTMEAVASVVVNYPLDVLQDSARPAYWVPNHKLKKCSVCNEAFGPKLSIHHCRSCGLGVCDSCSIHRCAVPSRGWDHPVRVCKTCKATL